MTLRRGHELGIAVCATSAYLAVLLGGAMPPLAWFCVLAPWVGLLALIVRGGRNNAVGLAIGVAALASGVLTIATMGTSATLLAAAYSAMGLLAARLLSRKTTRHDVQVLLLALVVVLAGSALNFNLSYALTFVAFVVAAVFSLSTRQLLESAERTYGDGARFRRLEARSDVLTGRFFVVTLLVTLVVLSSTAVIFAVFPRVGFNTLSFLNQGRDRLPGEVGLQNGAVRVLGDSEVAARVYGIPRAQYEEGLYLRGVVYDRVDEEGFSRFDVVPRGPGTLAAAGVTQRYEITQQPFGGARLLTLGPVLDAIGVRGGTENSNRHIRVFGSNERTELLATSSPTSPFRYRVFGRISTTAEGVSPPRARPASPENLQHHLRLPETLDPRISALADRLTASSSTAAEKSRAIEAHLLTFAYTLDEKSHDEPSALTGFLFGHKSGHCEFFATAYAVLLRAAGVPARVTGGFQGGRWDESESKIVLYGNNAHVWVEYYDDEVDLWRTVDATPPSSQSSLSGFSSWLEQIRSAWDDTVIDYSFSEQRIGFRKVIELLRQAKLLLVVMVVLAGVLLVVVRVLRHNTRGGRRRDEHPIVTALLRALSRRVVGGDAAQTLREIARDAPLDVQERDLVERCIKIYERDRFGPGATASLVDEATRKLARLDRGRSTR